jgi:glucosyl-3-phosphoglycerate phosphatase
MLEGQCLNEVLLRPVRKAERTLVLIRHGQTDWNVEERFQGQLDVAMNAVGRRQAANLKSYLGGTVFDKVYSSPLGRAFETAQLIAGASPIIPDRRLSEIHHGFWQGRTRNEIYRCWPDQWKRWQEQPHFTPRNGEPRRRVRLRVEDFLRSMQGTNILCVSHGVIIQTFVSVLLGASCGGQVPHNASIHTFFFRGNEICRYSMTATR